MLILRLRWKRAVSLLLSVLAAGGLNGSLRAEPDWKSKLHSPDLETRWKEINAIQTLDDPQIPAECLPLLQDGGSSIRRQAARAIGSRFAQIPPADRDRYVRALQACAAAGPEDVLLICQRAIGLLTQNYAFPSFSISPNGKWVLYERRRLPVIADIVRQQHRLLSPWDAARAGGNDEADLAGSDETDEGYDVQNTGLLKLMRTNESAADLFAPHWHPGGDAIAFSLETLQARFYHPIIVWSTSHPEAQVLNFETFQPLLSGRQHEWGTTTDFAGWKGAKVLVKIYDILPEQNDDAPHNEVIVSYDIQTEKIALEK